MSVEAARRIGQTLAILFESAEKDSNQTQMGRLKSLRRLVKENHMVHPENIGARIFEIMGSEWMPGPKYMDLMDSVAESTKGG